MYILAMTEHDIQVDQSLQSTSQRVLVNRKQRYPGHVLKAAEPKLKWMRNDKITLSGCSIVPQVAFKRR